MAGFQVFTEGYVDIDALNQAGLEGWELVCAYEAEFYFIPQFVVDISSSYLKRWNLLQTRFDGSKGRLCDGRSRLPEDDLKDLLSHANLQKRRLYLVGASCLS